ncbi:excinuclease ABC subunit UvrA [Amycolatopsis sp. 195334CR]|uniref:ATP-binding cassette domain-containing protein n=1 Tax=Amycolatopsis sp. 195334CR TaxID=2814588 RepID=UPI001A8DDC6D|nr:excinuclease ABC subunit UvrA [Amycolatopsis sp. 195334CR]MBN6039872.1 excinuclease ABC subunit UvrA [Amycolatopsis sp. 195334CR]
MAGRRANDSILLEGVRQHNLKNVSLRLPKGQLTVFTGVSGSGKSSLVFGTIAVESQRQLNETFPWFIRNRLAKYERPRAEVMRNLSTAIVVDQKPIGGNSRSTVGTMTEISPILRVLFSRHGEPGAGPSTLYSFNDPQGMCDECQGLGRTVRLDLGSLLDETKSLNDGAIRSPLFAVGGFQWQLYAQSGLFDPDKPVKKFTKKEKDLLLHGEGFKVKRPGRELTHSNEYEGLVLRFNRRYLKNGLDALKEKERRAVEEVVKAGVCAVCRGGRLNKAALASKINGKNIADYSALEVSELLDELGRIDDPVAKPVVQAAVAALERVEAIGLGYLSLDRETSTLSGGEGQRLKTVRHLGSSLSDLTFIFDEPSVALHPRDVHRLNELLGALRDKGNTVLVVEHNPDVMAVADHLVDMGPGAGTHGGEVVFEGTYRQLCKADTPTGRRLRQYTGLKDEVREPDGALTIRHAKVNNLRDVTVDIPAGVLTAVTGVAGSGKSSLISGVFAEQYPDAVMVDQSSIGISSRSTPATYVDIMDTIRKMFAKANDADAGLFSFNSTGGCPACQGRGVIQTDLAYMDPVTVTCEVCEGRRYRDEALSKTLGGKSIVDVLALTVEEALSFFTEDAVVRKLTMLREVGLSYLTLGQPLSTLSGGERQRLKLAHRLRDTGSVFVFDEPTTGLHMADVDTLLALFDRLVNEGNTVIVVEHDLEVVKHADWVIDLGPDAGRHGGRVVFEGTPSELTGNRESVTAEYLRADLKRAAR